MIFQIQFSCVFSCDSAMAQAAEDHRADKEMLYEFHAFPMTD